MYAHVHCYCVFTRIDRSNRLTNEKPSVLRGYNRKTLLNTMIWAPVRGYHGGGHVILRKRACVRFVPVLPAPTSIGISC